MLNVISITAIMIATFYLLFFMLVWKDVPVPPLSLFLAVALGAGLELFDLLALQNPEHLLFWKKFSLIVEALLPPVWLWFSLTYSRQKEPRTIFQRFLLAASFLFPVCALILPVSSFLYSPDFALEKVLFLGHSGFLFYLMIMVYLIIALINLEITLVQATLTTRWKIKFEMLGAGAFLAVLIIYYSQSLLFRTINMQLVTTRSVVLIVAVAMMAYSRLKRGTGVTVYVSRQMAYKSMVLLVVGIYLIGLGLAGEGMKYFNDGFQRALIIAIGFLAGLGMTIILLSETVKRKIRIFLHKNFYQHKYDYRNQWLQFTDRLSSSQTEAELLCSIVRGFCETFGMGKGALFTLNQERETYHQTGAIATNTTSVTFNVKDTVIECLAGKKSIVDLREKVTITENERHRKFFNEVEACFIIPLYMNEGLDGFIVFGRPLSSKETYDYEDLDLMKTLAKQASSTLLNLRLSDQLTRSREMAAIGKVSTFVMHDLKNLVSALSLMLENAQEHGASPDFQRVLFASLGNLVNKMNRLISRLKHLPEKDSLQRTPVDLLQMVQETASMVKGRELQVKGTHVLVDIDREEFQKVALNLMLNAVEATEGRTPVLVEVGEYEFPFLRVKDEGSGISEEILHHSLFSPFKSTKKKGLGIGLYQSKQIVEAHGGKIEVVSEINKGSVFTVWLPKIQSITSRGTLSWKNS